MRISVADAGNDSRVGTLTIEHDVERLARNVVNGTRIKIYNMRGTELTGAELYFAINGGQSVGSGRQLEGDFKIGDTVVVTAISH